MIKKFSQFKDCKAIDNNGVAIGIGRTYRNTPATPNQNNKNFGIEWRQL
jgi:hypothetical protein